MIVDFFPFFAPYGEQLLELRVNLLKDHVDYFVISESNKTHSGQPIERKFREIAKKLDLPLDKIIYIQHEIPEDADLEILPIDIENSYNNREKIESQKARARERLQKDSLLMALDDFDEDTVFIHSDSDEIINPAVIEYFASVCRQNQEIIIKVPLVYLEGKADLRLHNRNDGSPVEWAGGMFFATKSQLRKATPSQIRSDIDNPFHICHITENGEYVKDVGWHLSWMGGTEKRIIKTKNWAHYNDSFDWMSKGGNSIKYSDSEYIQFLSKTPLAEGQIPPSGNNNHILKKYPVSELPSLILEKDHLKRFFLGCNDHKVVLVTGGFDPIHSGHIAYFEEAKKLGDVLIVGINSNDWLTRKKGQPFMDVSERVSIVKNLSMVDSVIVFNDDDGSSKDAIHHCLEAYPSSRIVFANGGDRNSGNIPESEINDPRIEFAFGVGGTHKMNSSSKILTEWKTPRTERKWGYYRVLHADGPATKVKELVVEPGKSLSLQKHYNRSEYWVVTYGVGKVLIGDDETNLQEHTLKKHASVVIHAGQLHQLINDSTDELRIVEIQYGSNCIEEDIVRI